MIINLRRNRVIKIAERFYNLCRPGRICVFETEAGLKCLFGRFSSNRLDEYVEDEMPLKSAFVDSSDLLLSADFLRDRYTLCGVSLLQSPHFSLMQQMASGTLTQDSDYVLRCKSGTLDSRLPFDPDLEQLRHCFQLRLGELNENKPFYIYVRRIIFKEKPVYLIADGKHKAALATYFNRTDCLYLRFVSSKVNQEPFFRQIYDRILSLDPQEYSINQNFIRAIRDEYQAKTDC
ncbi:MAG: hypothetical protein QHH26_10200 [Armatimonadota bacterium]|nr:hypothetical protein [Armatimonadota bacterium]